MFDPNRLQALNNSIALRVIAAMNPASRDAEALISAPRRPLEDFEARLRWGGLSTQTDFSRYDRTPAHPHPLAGSSPYGESLTCLHGCSLSMVSGEEQLKLTDGVLDGLLPLAFTRLYRSSAVKIDCGLGWGWSHSLAHRLEQDSEQVVWTDHENRCTTFALPSVKRPATPDGHARATLYLGDEPQELILVVTGDATRIYYFQNGQLARICDAYDNRLHIARDAQGRIQRLDNGAGRSLLLRYERRHIVAIEYQTLRSTGALAAPWRTVQTLVSYSYDARHRLVEATNAAGESERYDYDDQHVILQRQLAGGASHFWEWQYRGKASRCVRHWASFSQMDRRYVWDDAGGVTVQNVDGSEEVYVHNDQGRLIRRVAPDGGKYLKDYNDEGLLIAEQNPLGAITRYRYDEFGRLTEVIPPKGESTSYEYRNGFLHDCHRQQAHWKTRRNAQGDVTEATDPDGHVTHYQYDAKGQLVSIRYPDTSDCSFVWSELGQLIEQTLPDRSRRNFTYDVLGRRITRQDEYGSVTRYQWDAVGRLTQAIRPTDATRTFSYNAYGKITAEQDELGRVTRYEYADDLHVICRKINPDGTQVRYRHNNAKLLLTEIENESGDQYQLDYTPNGLIRQETRFDGHRIVYTYDLNGHVLEKTEFGNDGSQRITAYLRDTSGQLQVETLSDNTKVIYHYDNLGRLAGIDNNLDHPLAFEYDQQDRLIAEHQGEDTLRYEYDACGQLKHLRLPDNSKLDYHHATGGALTAIDLNGARLTSHTFISGREQTRQQGVLLSEYTYDDQCRLKTHVVGQAMDTLFRRDYSYSQIGNLDNITDTRHGQRSYQHDVLNRLICARDSRDHLPENFAHDPAGNLLMLNRHGSATVKGNRLLMQGGRHYDYDAYGNLIRERRDTAHKLVTQYHYDCQHRLINVTLPNGRTAHYRYDALGRRISKTVDNKTTRFFWQGNHLVIESSNDHCRSYIYEPDTLRPLAMLDSKGPHPASTFYYQLDHLGMPQELTDSSGVIVWAAQYTVYGRLTRLNRDTHQFFEQPLRFQGQYFDNETGLHCNEHRYYNPDIGRYLTQVPMSLAGGLNGYGYSLNPAE